MPGDKTEVSVEAGKDFRIPLRWIFSTKFPFSANVSSSVFLFVFNLPRANAGFSLQIVAPLKTIFIYSNYNAFSVSVHTAQGALCKVRWPFIQKLKSRNHFTMDQKILVRLFFPFENVNILPATLDGMVDSVALNVFEYLKGL